jgi:hypothetical protein
VLGQVPGNRLRIGVARRRDSLFVSQPRNAMKTKCLPTSIHELSNRHDGQVSFLSLGHFVSLCDASSPGIAVVVGFASWLQHEKTKSLNAATPAAIAPLQKENHAPNITNDVEAGGLWVGEWDTKLPGILEEDR